MFIHSHAARQFKNPATGEIHRVDRGYVGEIPDWVGSTAYFQMCCADGSITALISQPTAAPTHSDPATAERLQQLAREKAMAEQEYEDALREAGISNSASTADTPDPAPAAGASAKKTEAPAPAKAKRTPAKK